MLSLFTALISANWRLNLLIFMLFFIPSIMEPLPVIGRLVSLASGFALALLMASIVKTISQNPSPETVKEELASKEISQLLSTINPSAVMGAYIGMLINTIVIAIASVLFTTLLLLPVATLAIFHPEQWKAILGSGKTALYVVGVVLLTLYIALNFFFTATVAMAKGFLQSDFWHGLLESLKGLTPKYFLLSLKPGLWKPTVALTLIAIFAVSGSFALAILMGLMGLPIFTAFGSLMGLILFHANIAYHYTCMKIMGLL